MYNIITNNIIKILRNLFCSCLTIIILIYLLIAAILLYIGPLETIIVKLKLKNNPVDVVLSFTTTPYRIDQLKPVLESITRQSIKPNRIYVNIPWKFKRDNTEYVIPDWLKSYPNIIINRTEDYGPATKLLATLEKERNPNAILITVDDDKTYSRHMVRDLVKPYLFGYYKTNTVFTGIGLNLLFTINHDAYIEPIVLGRNPSLVVVGAYGFASKRSFFKDDIFSFIKNLPLTCFLSDDLTISAYLLNSGVNIITTSGVAYYPLFFDLFFNELPAANTKDALSHGANGVATGGNESNYTYCLDYWLANDKADLQRIILTRSKLIHESFVPDSFYVGMMHFGYYYLGKLFKVFPFVERMIFLSMG